MAAQAPKRSAFEHFAPDVHLWRYVDFAKLISMLESSSLIFQSPKRFGDPFEGIIHAPALSELAKSVLPYHCELKPSLADEFDALRRRVGDSKARRQYENRLADCIVVSSWHCSDHESDAMWRLYSKPDQGLAIRSDVRSLVGILPDGLGDVLPLSYVNFDERYPPREGSLFVKRKAFEHEKEARAFFFCLSDFSLEERSRTGRRLPEERLSLDPSAFIKEVVVSPLAEDWYEELVGQVIRRYGQDIPVRSSAMRNRPAFLDNTDETSRTNRRADESRLAR